MVNKVYVVESSKTKKLDLGKKEKYWLSLSFLSSVNMKALAGSYVTLLGLCRHNDQIPVEHY